MLGISALFSLQKTQIKTVRAIPITAGADYNIPEFSFVDINECNDMLSSDEFPVGFLIVEIEYIYNGQSYIFINRYFHGDIVSWPPTLVPLDNIPTVVNVSLSRDSNFTDPIDITEYILPYTGPECNFYGNSVHYTDIFYNKLNLIKNIPYVKTSYSNKSFDIIKIDTTIHHNVGRDRT